MATTYLFSFESSGITFVAAAVSMLVSWGCPTDLKQKVNGVPISQMKLIGVTLVFTFRLQTLGWDIIDQKS